MVNSMGNSVKTDFVPFVVQSNKEIADLFVKEWVKQWKPKNKAEYRYKFTNPQAQK
jgi:hypothetical protein